MNYGEGLNVLWGNQCPYNKNSDSGTKKKRYLIPQENLVGPRFSLDDNNSITLGCSGTIHRNTFPYRFRRTYFPYLPPSPKARASYGVKDAVIQWQEWKQDWKHSVRGWKQGRRSQDTKTIDNCIKLIQDKPEVGGWSFTGGCIACPLHQETRILVVSSGEEGDRMSVIPLEDSNDDVFLLKANESKLWIKTLKHGRILQITSATNGLLGVRQSQRASLWSLKTKDHCLKAKKKSAWQSEKRLSCMCLSDIVEGEFCTVDIDENFIVHDGVKGTCKYMKESHTPMKGCSSYWHCVEYTSHPRIVHLANKSQIQTIDFRCPPEMRSKLVLSCAGVERFTEPYEEISLLKSAKQDSYFYVGTSHCVFMADERFLNSAVQKWIPMFKSFPFYCSSVTDSEYEVLFVSSQLNSETVCIVNDWKHASCKTIDSQYGEYSIKTLCTQENATCVQIPTNPSPPKYLATLQDTIDLAKSKGIWCEPEIQKVISPHIIGLACIITGTLQERISVFTVTSTGDVFSQELVLREPDITILPLESGDLWFASQQTNAILNQNVKEEITQRELDHLHCWITNAISLMETKLTCTEVKTVSRITEASNTPKKKRRSKKKTCEVPATMKEGIGNHQMNDLGKYTDTYAVKLLKEWMNENEGSVWCSERQEDGYNSQLSATDEDKSRSFENDIEISFTAVKNEIMSDSENDTKISLTTLKSEIMSDSGNNESFHPSVICELETASSSKKDRKRESFGTDIDMFSNTSVKSERDIMSSPENDYVYPTYYSLHQSETLPSETSITDVCNIPVTVKLYPENLSTSSQQKSQNTYESSTDLDSELICSQSESVISSSQPVRKKRNLFSQKKKKPHVHGF